MIINYAGYNPFNSFICIPQKRISFRSIPFNIKIIFMKHRCFQIMNLNIISKEFAIISVNRDSLIVWCPLWSRLNILIVMTINANWCLLIKKQFLNEWQNNWMMPKWLIATRRERCIILNSLSPFLFCYLTPIYIIKTWTISFVKCPLINNVISDFVLQV